MTIAIVCSAVLAALVFGLGANVTRLRAIRAKTGEPQASFDPADRLFIAVRAHGNATEYVPTLMILFLLLGAEVDTWWTAALTIAATAARVLHAVGMLTAQTLAAESHSRVLGAIGTYAFGLALAGAALAAV